MPLVPREQSPGPHGVPVWALLALVLLLWVAWQLLPVLLLVFAGALFALLLGHAMEPLQRHLHLRPNLALLVVVLGLLLLIGLGSWQLGAAAAGQLQALGDTLPQAWQALLRWVSSFAPGRWLIELWNPDLLKPHDLRQLARVASGTLNATVGVFGSVIVILFIGLYLAADPHTYRRGLLRLLPASWHARGLSTLDAAAGALSRWLVGQGISMVAVAALMTAGLAVVGMPLALPLGLIAGLLEFVPYFGTAVSAVLVVSVALTIDEETALWAGVVCLVVQQAEAYLVQPLVQRWAVRLPPVLSIVAVLVFGLLFGLPGVLLAAPLMVLSMTLVDQLYARATLGGGSLPSRPP